MRRAHRFLFVLTLGLSSTAGSRAALTQRPSTIFPHEKHGRVFPVCEGCHAGIVSGDASAVYPGFAECQRCHDGLRVTQVDWRAPAPRVSILRFSHSEHRAATGRAGDSTTCLTCHTDRDPPRRDEVGGPSPERCVSCHAHRAPRHLAPTAACRTCHVPITAQPRLSAERVSRLPQPPWHDAAGFASDHGRVSGTAAASCAVCHARESCERCHANAASVPLIAGLARDARHATLVAGRAAVYRAPASHRGGDWRAAHGADARRSTESCANCHTQPSCTACHAGGSGTARVAILSLPGPGVRQGLGVRAPHLTSGLHEAGFSTRHGTAAAAGRMNCTQCHTERACAACHAAPDSRRLHAENFVERHAVDVFSSAADCQSCHNTERFCRDCHSRTGVASSGRMNAAFHTGQPNWVLSHGQAARMGMESCASCHRQADCVRCHSATGGWGVNPHRSGFRAGALAERNVASCRWCHVGALPGRGH
jgi:hypothetical protein